MGREKRQRGGRERKEKREMSIVGGEKWKRGERGKKKRRDQQEEGKRGGGGEAWKRGRWRGRRDREERGSKLCNLRNSASMSHCAPRRLTYNIQIFILFSLTLLFLSLLLVRPSKHGSEAAKLIMVACVRVSAGGVCA